MDPQQTPAPNPSRIHWRAWMPSRGNLLTLGLVVILLLAQNSGTFTLGAPLATQGAIHTFAYQGRLADAGGTPLTGTYNMIFRLYSAPSGGSPLWEEQWTGSNSVQVSDGLFNIMLGSLSPIPQNIVSGSPALYLGLTVDTDNEMSPRVQFGSVPYAFQALTVPDGSITAAKLSPDLDLVPSGVIVMWGGATDTVPSGWVLCDGSNSTPDLRNRFVVGAGSQHAVGDTGGEDMVTLTIGQMPAHDHGGTTSTAGQHTHTTYIGGISRANNGSNGTFYFSRTDTYDQNIDPGWLSSSAGAHSHTISSQGGGQAFDNRPPYYALAYICKQ